MTEKQAKDILDFLAKKAGWIGIDIRRLEVDSMGTIGCISNDPTSFRVLVVDDMFGRKRITSKDCSYIECLRKIFKKSKEGHVIKILAYLKPFLEANMNLDTILVEMDLEV